MPHINYDRHEIAFKLVYFGPGMSGKTTNLTYIHNKLDERRRSAMITLDTTDDRTLFFDFLPLELGTIAGYSIRFNMYTVPGQIYYESTRRLILDGADGVVFVADSQTDREEENIVSWRMMEENLRALGHEPLSFPLVLQYNKRDCNNALPVGALERELDLTTVPTLEAVATTGQGVMETVRTVSYRVIQQFQL